MKLRFPLLLVALALFGQAIAFAHEARPGYLELTETGPDTYSFLWKRPSAAKSNFNSPPSSRKTAP